VDVLLRVLALQEQQLATTRSAVTSTISPSTKTILSFNRREKIS